MKSEFKKAIEDYQCPGCVFGCDITCFGIHDAGIGCGRHYAGTGVLGGGKFFLGMPKGFNELGSQNELKPYIFESYDKSAFTPYDKFNVAVWKHKDEYGNTLVRGMMPRRNEPFIHIYLEDCIDKIECLEITKGDIDEMD